MKSKFLFTTVVFAGLTGMISAQSVAQRVPGEGEYGRRERPRVVANMVTPEQLTQWMRASMRSNTATADQWCYAMGQLVPGGYTCPGPDQFGFTGNLRYSRVDAQTFLNNLRAYETGAYSAPAYSAPYARSEGPAGEERPGLAACRHAVTDRLRDQGYYEVHIPSITAEDRRGGEDRVYGSAEAQRQGLREHFDFSCGVNLERGEIRSLDINPR
jgi:hypothetical protein